AAGGAAGGAGGTAGAAGGGDPALGGGAGGGDPALGGGTGGTGGSGGSGGQQVSADSMAIAADAGSGLRYSLMVIAVLLLGAVVVLPPLVAGRAAGASKERA
ncbi:hypothetical protein ACFXI0_20530, partial [Kitasatospora indigofera]